MTLQFASIVRTAVLLALALVATSLLRRRSAVARRLVLTVAFAAVPIIPLLPAWHVGGPTYHALVGRLVAEPSGAALGGAVARAAPAVESSSGWVSLVWWLGVVAVGARFAFGLFLAQRLVARAAPAPTAWRRAIVEAERISGKRAVVRVAPAIDAPVLAGLLRPVTLVPPSSASWSEERKVSVLLHELAHVAAHDLGVQLLVHFVCTMHWFNPLVWLAARRLRLERELAADEAVLRTGVRASSYAAHLLAIAGMGHAGTIAIAEEPLARRIAAIVAARRPPDLGSRRFAAFAAGSAAIALAVACASTAESTSPRAAPEAIDRDVQVFAEAELARTVADWNAAGGTILVTTARGEVIASAGRADDLVVVGSTLKAFSLAAAIDEGVVHESDVFDCSDGARGERILQDAEPLGHIALPELVARSGNIGFARIFDRLGGARLDRALRRFRFATPPELAAAAAGDWDGGLLAIGATMSATPRQVARAYAMLAAGGEGVVKTSTAARVTALLEGVVASEQGTGKRAQLPGVRVAGKTGSSEWTTAAGTRTYASFVGYVPAERPRYVVFVGVDTPRREEAWGGTVAAPVFARIAARVLAR